MKSSRDECWHSNPAAFYMRKIPEGFPYKFPKYLATTYSEMQRSGIERSDKGAKQIILQEVNCLILKE